MEDKNIFFDKNGHINDIWTAIIADNLREGKGNNLPEKLKDHLEGCELCRDSAFDVFCAITHSEETQYKIPEMFTLHKAEPKKNSYGIFLRTAATLLVLTFISMIYLNITKKSTINNKLIEESVKKKNIKIFNKDFENIYKKGEQTTVKKTGQRMNSTKARKQLNPFKDNPNLEYMVDSTHRGRMIQIISPEFKIIKEGDLVFRWQNHIDKKLILKILNNVNETLYTFVAKGSMVEFHGELNPGLYYWKLEDKENLYHVGKFIIREPIISRTK